MFSSFAARPPTDMLSLNSLLSHIKSLVMVRKYSPASGSVSVAQRSNIRQDLTNSSFQMFSQSWIWLTVREAGRSISNDDRIISGGTLPPLSTRGSTSKERRSEKFENSFISRKSIGVVKQIKFFIGPSR